MKEGAEEVLLVATEDAPVPASDVLLTPVTGESTVDEGVIVVVTTMVPVTNEEMVVTLALWEKEDEVPDVTAEEFSAPGGGTMTVVITVVTSVLAM